MSVEELARAFGVSAELLRNFENGESELRDAENYRLILDRLERDGQPQRDR